MKPGLGLRIIVSIIGKNPQIEVMTSAGSDGNESFNEYKKIFSEIGVTAPGHIHHDGRSDVLNDDLGERIKNADALFIAGGDQLKLHRLVRRHRFTYPTQA